MSTRVESLLAKSQSAMKPIELAPGRYMKPANRFLMKETLSEDSIKKAIDELKAEGAKHGFTNPNAGQYGMPQLAYNAEADRESWAFDKFAAMQELAQED